MPAPVDWATTLKPFFPTPITNVSAKKLQSLWAGYGSVSSLRVQLQGAPPTALIVKDVRPQRASGVSHERKVASYQVEAVFYKDHAQDLIDKTTLGVPRPIAIDSTESGFQFILTDLSKEYPDSAGGLNDQQVRSVLNWLATYHAYFWERPTPSGLQQQGSYWYLDTRRDEFAQIGRSWSELKAVAERVDARLKTTDDEFMTCIHGDMKNENILFTEDGSRCGAYDFQYTGRSYGVRDIVYFFASSVDSTDLEANEEEYLAHYHSALAARLTELRGPEAGAEVAARYHPAVMRRHFDLALLDYVRFMAGWGLWGSGVDWAVRRARALLPTVDKLLRQ